MRTMTTLLLAALLTTACAGGEEDLRGDPAPAAVDTAADADAAHDHAPAAPGGGQTLLVIMQKLGSDMAALTHGIMTEDTALVARSAADVAAHPDIAPGELARIQAELGTAMAEFERLDAVVHEASVALHDAARTGDMDAVLSRLHEVQRGCVACHTQFRERLRTAAPR